MAVATASTPYVSKYHLPENWETSFISTILRWYITRPEPPKRSITAHHIQLLKSIVHSRGLSPGPDGMIENYKVVTAEIPSATLNRAAITRTTSNSSDHFSTAYADDSEDASVIATATREVLSISTSLLLLPLRLMRLAMSTLGSIGARGYEYLHFGGGIDISKLSMDANDIVWLTESPINDLGSCLFLLLAHNKRAEDASGTNMFRAALSSLQDDRWKSNDIYHSPSFNGAVGFESPQKSNQYDGLEEFDPEMGGAEHMVPVEYYPFVGSSSSFSVDGALSSALSANFEQLFQAFGNTLHTEVGALMFYTFVQSCPSFASAVSVRSDLDALVLPLLRTLYFSSVINQSNYSSSLIAAKDQNHVVSNVTTKLDEKALLTTNTETSYSKPFRSHSQLYLVMILLLLFSQDASFGPDAFRRITVSHIAWYKERQLRDISLGSVIMLCLLRSMTFNLSRLRDGFLLSNTLAVLLNLTPHAVNVHPYAALRLVSVTINCMKRYSEFPSVDMEEDMNSTRGMYGETSRSLLRFLTKSVRNDVMEKNMHIVYALVYRKAELDSIISENPAAFSKVELGKIPALVSQANSLLSEDNVVRSAEQAMDFLKINISSLKAIGTSPFHSGLSPGNSDEDDYEDFTYEYEEEDDPEIFFLPYVWEVVSCVVTSGVMDWDKSRAYVYSHYEDDQATSTESTQSLSSDSLVRDEDGYDVV